MNILITGSSGGIGSGILSALQQNKENLLFVHYHSKKPQETTNQQPIQGDLLSESDVEKLTKIINDKGGVDVIIHSVSLPTKIEPFFDKTWHEFQSHIDVQVKSLFLLSKYLSPSMKRNKFGRIISLASEYTIGRPPTKLSDYITAKHALVGLTKSLAVELGPFGITANCISAGLTETPLTAHLPNKLKEIIKIQTPTQKLTTPDDIAELVKFLIASSANMINGENILINGGYTMR